MCYQVSGAIVWVVISEAASGRHFAYCPDYATMPTLPLHPHQPRQTVEFMRGGMDPKLAAEAALRRIVRRYSGAGATFGLFAVNATGYHGGAAFGWERDNMTQWMAGNPQAPEQLQKAVFPWCALCCGVHTWWPDVASTWGGAADVGEREEAAPATSQPAPSHISCLTACRAYAYQDADGLRWVEVEDLSRVPEPKQPGRR